MQFSIFFSVHIFNSNNFIHINVKYLAWQKVGLIQLTLDLMERELEPNHFILMRFNNLHLKGLDKINLKN